jgi:hypothetical protein
MTIFVHLKTETTQKELANLLDLTPRAGSLSIQETCRSALKRAPRLVDSEAFRFQNRKRVDRK